MVETLYLLERILETLQETRVCSEDFDFGPTYSMAESRRLKVIKEVKKKIKTLKNEL